VIDHHRGSELQENENNFIWIEDIGAASTLVVELIQAAGIEVVEEKQFIFALLALGIHNDTSSMRCDGKRDREAFHFARSHCSTEEFYKLTDYTLPESYFDYIGSSYVSRSRQGSKMVMGAGKILSKHGDVLSKIADEAIQMEGVSLVVVWAIINDEVRLCARSNDLSNPLDDLLKQRFGPNSGGAKQSFGGKGIGGAKLDLNFGFWAGSEVDQEVRQVVDKKIQTLVFSDS
jgi:nanoRNase/pAp phosphatase (c-di-AMP/oligoRNAs hydrolase)